MNSKKRQWKHYGWKLQESQRDIEEFLKLNDCPGVYKTSELFALWGLPVNNYAARGLVSRGEHVILLDIIPGVIEIGIDNFRSITKFILHTSRGTGWITFQTCPGDGGILPRVKRMLDVSH